LCSAVNGVCVAPTANDAAFRKGSREGRGGRDAEGRRVETEEGTGGRGRAEGVGGSANGSSYTRSTGVSVSGTT